jgi:hypothetical protein
MTALRQVAFTAGVGAGIGRALALDLTRGVKVAASARNTQVLSQLAAEHALPPRMIVRGAVAASIAGYAGVPGARLYTPTDAAPINLAEGLYPDPDQPPKTHRGACAPGSKRANSTSCSSGRRSRRSSSCVSCTSRRHSGICADSRWAIRAPAIPITGGPPIRVFAVRP